MFLNGMLGVKPYLMRVLMVFGISINVDKYNFVQPSKLRVTGSIPVGQTNQRDLTPMSLRLDARIIFLLS